MPTAAGWTALAAAAIAATVGRIFAIPALFIAAAALILIPIFGLAAILLRPGRIEVDRQISPGTLVAGEAGVHTWAIRNDSRLRCPPMLLDNRLIVHRPGGTAHSQPASFGLQLGPIAPQQSVLHTTALASPHRGVIELLPVVAERSDLFGTVRRRTMVCPGLEIPVLPETIPLLAPALGRGVLGRLLTDRARRLGLEEFEGLREYTIGDEPRSIHWRASARTGDLKVRENSTDGIRRCIVVIDTSEGDEDALDLLTGAAASVIETATSAGLTTRLVASGGLDLRGPNITSNALALLAGLESGPPVGSLERDPSDGLGLAVICAAHNRRGEEIAQALGENSLVSIVISTLAPNRYRPEQHQYRPAEPGSRRATAPPPTRGPNGASLSIVASTLEELQRHWRHLNVDRVNGNDMTSTGPP